MCQQIRCTGDATYSLADGVNYGCGNSEGQCLCVSRSDTRGGAAYALDDCILYGCGKSGAGTCVRRPDTHGMQPTELILGIFQNGPTPPPNLKSGPELPHPISKVGQKVLKEKSHNR